MQGTPQRWPLWAKCALCVGGWTAFGLFFTTQTCFRLLYDGKPPLWGQMLVLWLAFSYVYCALTPFVLWMARRYPLERRRWLRRLPLHLAASVTVAFVGLAIFVPLSHLIAGDPAKPFSVVNVLVDVMFWEFHLDILIYWAILGLDHTVEYYRRYQDRELKAAQLQAQLAQAQLEALKMQLHPHFLFNTLNSIAVLMQTDVPAAKHTLICLSRLLRGALQASQSHEVALRQEVEFLRNYLEIEQTRFQDRLSAKLSVDPEALDAQVPYFILQPLVENAIRHGDAGHIEVTARRANETVRITVSDSGPGMQEDSSATNGIGLTNTRARLEKLYGADCRFELHNSPEGGFVAAITIPFRVSSHVPAELAGVGSWNESAY